MKGNIGTARENPLLKTYRLHKSQHPIGLSIKEWLHTLPPRIKVQGQEVPVRMAKHHPTITIGCVAVQKTNDDPN